jgi:hypothetical protein
MTIKQQSEKETKNKAFRNWDYGRLHLNFPNGNTISTIWGEGSYTENYNSRQVTDFVLGETERYPVMASDTVEIMFDCSPRLQKRIIKKYNEGDPQPIGYLTITQWVEIVSLISKDDIKKNK